MKGKTKLWLWRAVIAVLWILSLVFFVVWLERAEHGVYDVAIVVLFLVISIALFWLGVRSLLGCACKVFGCGGNVAEVYRGLYVYSLKINGKTVSRKFVVFGLFGDSLCYRCGCQNYEAVFPRFGRQKILLTVNGMLCSEIR